MAAGSSTQTVKMRDGASIFTKTLNDEPAKPLLIAHHGGPGAGSHAQVEDVVSFLTPYYRIMVIDARGNGSSDKQGPYTRDQWAQDLEDIRQHTGAPQFALLGISHGGMVALTYATTHPSHVSALILLVTAAHASNMRTDLEVALAARGIQVDPAQQERLWSGALRDDADFAGAMGHMLSLSFAKPETARFVAEQMEEAARAGAAPSMCAAAMNGSNVDLQGYDVRGALGRVACPVFVGAGRHDVFAPPRYAEEIVRGIGGQARLVVFEESAHAPFMEERERYREEVEGFVKGLAL